MKFIIFSCIIPKLHVNNNIDGIWEIIYQEDPKGIAFTTLKNKCNTCHATKKRTDIFTLENMDGLAPEIWKQVFVKKKMPKGRKVELSELELIKLRNWLDSTLAKHNNKGQVKSAPSIKHQLVIWPRLRPLSPVLR